MFFEKPPCPAAVVNWLISVSIGSLYQYFPNKMAIVDSILQWHFDEILAVLRSAVDDDLAAPCVEKLVPGMIAVHSEHSSLHHVLLEDVPLSKNSTKAMSVSSRNISICTPSYWLGVHARDLRSTSSEHRSALRQLRESFTTRPAGARLDHRHSNKSL